MPGSHYQLRHAAATAAALWLAPAMGSPAAAQTPDTAAGAISLGARGGIAAAAPPRATSTQDAAGSSLEFSARAGFATDYIYRGVTLSDRRPVVGAGLEAALGAF